MNTTEVTDSEAVVLLVLMAEARPVLIHELAKLGPTLPRTSRDKLIQMGLIESVRLDRSLELSLSDKGWAFCAGLIGSDAPEHSNGYSRALYTILASMRRWFDREDVRPSEVFLPRPASKSPVDVEGRVRAAYAELRSEPGAFVRLARLRPALVDLDREEVDAAIVRLQRSSGVSLIPEENQKTLTADDRAAAVFLGNQHNHLLAIH